MADISSYSTDFTGGMPVWLTDASTGDGSTSLVDGKLRLIAGDAAMEDGGRTFPSGDNFDSIYVHLSAHSGGSDNFNFWIHALDASYNGMSCLVIRNATTISNGPMPPGTGIRIYSVATGVPTMRAAGTYDRDATPWVRFYRSGANTGVQTAPASGNGPGLWSDAVETQAWADWVPTWTPGNMFLFVLGSFYSGTASSTIDIGAINSPLASEPPPSGGNSYEFNFNTIIL